VFTQFCHSPSFIPMESQCSVNIQRVFLHHTMNSVFSDILQAHTAPKHRVTLISPGGCLSDMMEENLFVMCEGFREFGNHRYRRGKSG